jgi:hypothetical protein
VVRPRFAGRDFGEAWVMAQVFGRGTNTISRVTSSGALFFAGAAVWLAWRVQRSTYVTEVDVARSQPVPFSHEHHVGGLGIDCRYCHNSVEETRFAGMPATSTCMTCHSRIWTESPVLEPVRESFRTGASITWVRVNDLPDYAYFNHAIHVNKGVGCVSCHGRVDRMPLLWQEATLHMEWCLDCHRAPEQHLRPREQVFRMNDARSGPTEGARLAKQYGIDAHQRAIGTSCSACHR